LLDVLTQLSRQGRISVGASGQMPHLRTPAVKGVMEPSDALAALLAGSDWEAWQAAPGVWQLRPRVRKQHAPVHQLPPTQSGVPIIVTATKRDERLSAAPTSISVIDGALLATQSTARGTSDIAAQAEGAFATNLGPGRDRIFLRGVADSAFNGPTQSTVALFLDDARINYAMPDPDLKLVDISRVEILRGPQGTLYGTGSLGGIVRLVTNRPDPDHASGSLALEASSVAHGDEGGDIEAILNMPIVRGTLALRAAGYADSTPGWIEDTERHQANINRVSRIGGRTDLRWHPSPLWTFDVSGAVQRLEALDSQYATDGLSRSTAIAEPHHNYLWVGRIEAKGRIGRYDLVSTSAIDRNQVLSRFDASSVAASQQLASPLAYDETRRLTLLTQEIRLSDPRATRPWVVGAAISDAVNRTVGTFEPAIGTPVEVRNQYASALEMALFGEATQSLGSALGLTVGLRAVHSSGKDESAATSRLKAEKNGLTPSATLAWHPRPQALVWLRYASAVRPGGLDQDSTGKVQIFQSDNLKSLEIGSRLSLLNGKLTLNSALFALNWLHVQSDIIGTDGLVATINAGNARNYGGEETLTFALHDVSMELGVTRQHGRLISSTVVSGNDLRLPVLPDISGRLRVSYARNFGIWNADGFVSANYSGPARLSFDPTLDRTIPAHFVANMGAGLGRARWHVGVSVSNLLNARQDTFSFGNPFTIHSLQEHTPYQPRTVTLRIERHF
jgi:outer membrane receptor protein involved in Fe transport